jgi:hypothetical protein
MSYQLYPSPQLQQQQPVLQMQPRPMQQTMQQTMSQLSPLAQKPMPGLPMQVALQHQHHHQQEQLQYHQLHHQQEQPLQRHQQYQHPLPKPPIVIGSNANGVQRQPAGEPGNDEWSDEQGGSASAAAAAHDNETPPIHALFYPAISTVETFRSEQRQQFRQRQQPDDEERETIDQFGTEFPLYPTSPDLRLARECQPIDYELEGGNWFCDKLEMFSGPGQAGQKQ